MISDLPPEILVRIFQFYLETESQENLLNNLSRVCDAWENICENSVLWTKFDGTVGHRKMMKLFERGCLNNTVELIFSKNECLSDNDAVKLFSGLRNLKVINFNQVSKFTKNTLSIIAESCCELKEILILKQSKTPIKLQSQKLKLFFAAKGENLTTIKLSCCYIPSALQVLRSMAEYCPNLEHLQLTNNSSQVATFPTSHFQLHCSRLKALHLDQCFEISKTKHPLGFPDLEYFSYLDCKGYAITDAAFECIAFNSPNLKFLTLVNCKISAKVLCAIPSMSMEYLYLCKSKVINDDNLCDVFKKWSHSLKEIDVSYSSNPAINKAVLNLVTLTSNSQLEYLDLNFSQVESSVVKKVLEACTQLEVLHLQGCRNLDRGLKKTYNGKSEFKSLFEKLCFPKSESQSDTRS